MKWTIWTTTEPLQPGQVTKAQGYSRWGSDLQKLVPIAFVYIWTMDGMQTKIAGPFFYQTWDWH